MYISGTFQDFETRLHEFFFVAADWPSFAQEAASYYSFVNSIDASYLIQRWDREFIKKGFLFVGAFSIDDNGQYILDGNGNPIINVN